MDDRGKKSPQEWLYRRTDDFITFLYLKNTMSLTESILKLLGKKLPFSSLLSENSIKNHDRAVAAMTCVINNLKRKKEKQDGVCLVFIYKFEQGWSDVSLVKLNASLIFSNCLSSFCGHKNLKYILRRKMPKTTWF